MWRESYVFFNDTATTEIYTVSLHDALPICADRAPLDLHRGPPRGARAGARGRAPGAGARDLEVVEGGAPRRLRRLQDRKSTRLNSSHANTSYAVFCLKKKNFTSTLTVVPCC